MATIVSDDRNEHAATAPQRHDLRHREGSPRVIRGYRNEA